MNSRDTPPGALTTQPLMTRVPISVAFPVRVTRWNDVAGTTTAIACDSNATPNVLGMSRYQYLRTEEGSTNLT
jgi:hypothetical protein